MKLSVFLGVAVLLSLLCSVSISSGQGTPRNPVKAELTDAWQERQERPTEKPSISQTAEFTFRCRQFQIKHGNGRIDTMYLHVVYAPDKKRYWWTVSWTTGLGYVQFCSGMDSLTCFAANHSPLGIVYWQSHEQAESMEAAQALATTNLYAEVNDVATGDFAIKQWHKIDLTSVFPQDAFDYHPLRANKAILHVGSVSYEDSIWELTLKSDNGDEGVVMLDFQFRPVKAILNGKQVYPASSPSLTPSPTPIPHHCFQTAVGRPPNVLCQYFVSGR